MDEFRPLIEGAVSETIAQIRKEDQMLGEQMAFTEREAARLLGLESYQFRDERRRGRIGSTAIVGRRIRYTRQDLLTYLARNRSEPRI